MQLVINLPDMPNNVINGLREAIKNGTLDTEVEHAILDAVSNGTVLPKGHGRLIDADKIQYYEVENKHPNDLFFKKSYMVWKPHIDGLKTIIEPDNNDCLEKEIDEPEI